MRHTYSELILSRPLFCFDVNAVLYFLSRALRLQCGPDTKLLMGELYGSTVLVDGLLF